jgi:hypothetical protein
VSPLLCALYAWLAPGRAQQGGALPWDEAPRSRLGGRARIDGAAWRQRGKPRGSTEGVRAPRRPWQHPAVERRSGRIRRAGLEHVIVRNAAQLRRRLARYGASYHPGRPPLALAMDGPEPRPVPAPDQGQVMAIPEIGGLHPH